MSSSTARLYQSSPPLCPVTALAFYQHGTQLLVLSGEGGWLAIYAAAGASTAAAATAEAAATAAAGRCLGRIRIFAEQAMQGIRVGTTTSSATDDSNCILVWGGSSVALVTREHIAHALSGDSGDSKTVSIAVDEVAAPDWIYDGLLPHTMGGLGALVTAHNEVVPFRVGVDAAAAGLRITLLSPTISPSRPMLYAAQLAWAGDKKPSEHDNTRSRLLVAAGTVFGEIVVWTCALAPAAARIKVHQVFTGHEGSIFDVVVSDEIDLAPPHNKKARLLASCSDDRTIRIWPLYLDAETDTETALETEPASLLAAARETGFQNTFEGLAGRSDVPTRQAIHTKQTTYLQSNDPAPPSSPTAVPPLATVMAHASRIWHVRFGELVDGSIAVYSFGEDAAAQEWRLTMRHAEPDGKHTGPLAAELVHLRTLNLHSGKNIWSAAVSAPGTAAGTRLVATGGSDGKICLFAGRPARATADGAERPTEVIVRSIVPLAVTGDDDPSPASARPKKTREEVFNSYAFLSESQLLAATNHGRLLLGEFREGAHGLSTASAMAWTALPGISQSVTQSLAAYDIVRSPRGGGGGGMAAVPGIEGLAFLGTTTGQLLLFSSASGQVHELPTRLPGKVDDIFFLPPTADSTTTDDDDVTVVAIELVATTLFRDEAFLLDMTIDTRTGTLVSCRSQRTLRLPKKTSTSPTAMIITAASRCLDYIVLGSRNGQLCLYRPSNSGDDTLCPETQLQTRTKDAVLSIVPLPPRPGHAPLSSSSFVVTARDGTYRIYSIERTGTGEQQPVHIALKHETATPFGPIVRDAWFVDSTSAIPGEPLELVVCGFRSTHFVVWNETRQQELATVDCGGTHRTHTYMFCGGSAATERIRFAFTRNAELHLFAQNTGATTPLKTGGHGREIRAVSASASGRYVATGAEDTVVRIWSNNNDNKNHAAGGDRRCLSVLKLHNTGLHNLVWLGDDCLISAAGSEELFIWRITTICDSAYDGLAVLCESSYPDSTSDKVLRIIGLDATLLDADADADAMLVSMGISNSVLKTYRYTRPGVPGGNGTWQLLAQGHYTGACPTQVRHLPMPMGEDSGRSLAVLAAFADGHLTVWTTAAPDAGTTGTTQPAEYTLVCATRAHQNAVKALDVLGQQSQVIFSGGDDNSIAVTTLNRADGDSMPAYTFGKTFRVSGAHAASINGAKILHSDASSFTAVTCSNDQRVKAWKVLMAAPGSEGPPVRVQLVSNCYSTIADPGDIECIDRTAADGTIRGAIVAGMGMETWSLGVS